MRFNIFTPFVFIATVVNSSAEIITDRFRIERTRRLKKVNNKEEQSFNGSPSTGDNNLRRESTNSRKPSIWWPILSPFNEVRLLLEYNQRGGLWLVIIVVHIFLLARIVIKCLAFSALPTDRDPLSGKFRQPILDWLESYYVIDLVHEIDESGGLQNQALGLLFVQYLLLRLKSLYDRFRMAKINRYYYKEISVVSLNLAHANRFYGTPMDWLRFVAAAYSHNCDLSATLHLHRNHMMKSWSKRVRNLEKTDRFYFFNHIDFETCFKGELGSVQPKLNRKCSVYEQAEVVRPPDDSHFMSRWRSKLASWTRFMLTIDLPNRRPFTASPRHRVDPHQVMMLLVADVLSLTVINLLVWYSAGAFAISALESRGLDLLNSNAKIVGPLFERLWTESRILFGLVDMLLVFYLIACNGYECSMLIQSSGFCLSRSNKVIKMIEQEVEYYQSHIKSFHAYVKERDLNFILSDKFDWFDSLPNGGTNYSRLPSRAKSKTRTLKRTINNNNHWLSCNNGDVFPCTIIPEYKFRVDPKRLSEFNDNVNYLIDLIEVLRCELDDLKATFTFFINTSIIFGTIASSITFGLLLQAQSLLKASVPTAIAAAALTSLMSSLVLGATNERAFRKIYRTIMPLMMDELGFTDSRVAKRIRNICEHIARIENRSFVLLGNLPLSFGTTASMVGWIATGNLLLPRFQASFAGWNQATAAAAGPN